MHVTALKNQLYSLSPSSWTPLKEMRLRFSMALSPQPPPLWTSHVIDQLPPLLRAYYCLAMAELFIHLASVLSFREIHVNNVLTFALSRIPDHQRERIPVRKRDLLDRLRLGAVLALFLNRYADMYHILTVASGLHDASAKLNRTYNRLAVLEGYRENPDHPVGPPFVFT